MILEGQVALVTGASRGIGRAIALALAEAGADVALAARDDGALQQVAGEVKAIGRQAVALPTDLLVREQIEDMVTQTAEQFGRLDILVNNAGSIVLKSFEETFIDEFETQIDLHYLATVVACKTALPYLKAGPGGRIINLSSISGTIGYEHHSAYSPAKGAVIRFSEAIAQELKPYEITVNCIAPNAVDTRLFDTWIAESGAELDRSGWIQPEEIGALAVFLCSPAARSITGETIVLQGVYPQ